MAKPDWKCPSCKHLVGRFTLSGDLYITEPGTVIERTRTGSIIHCPNRDCRCKFVFRGNRVISSESVLMVVREAR